MKRKPKVEINIFLKLMITEKNDKIKLTPELLYFLYKKGSYQNVLSCLQTKPALIRQNKGKLLQIQTVTSSITEELQFETK